MQENGIGLRDRKRQETRARLEDAATALALELGLENATVDAISQRAEVSPRTFFNYFDSKEDAILGVRDIGLTPEEIAEYIADSADSDLLSSIVGLLFSAIGPSFTDTAIRDRRMEIIHRFPQLMTRQIALMTSISEQLSEAVQGMLSINRVRPGPSDGATAETLLGICFSGLRVAMKEWLDAGGRESTEELEERTIALIHTTTERIA
jgi:AcrR family transcriptional regulator